MQISTLRFYQYPHLVFLFFYLFMQYPHHVLIFYLSIQYQIIVKGITFIHNINCHIRSFVFVFLISNAVAPPLIAPKGIHWAKDGPNFACRVDGCDASYTTKDNLVRHLWTCHTLRQSVISLIKTCCDCCPK